MRRFLVAVLITGCTPVVTSASVPSATPSPEPIVSASPTPSATPRPVLRAREKFHAERLEVSVVSEGADEIADLLRRDLADRWAYATHRLGRLTIRDDAGVVIITRPGPGRTFLSEFVRPDGSDVRVEIVLRAEHPMVQMSPLVAAVHELSHIWCCRDPGTIDGHWDNEGDEIMDTNGPAWSCIRHQDESRTCTPATDRFSDRELRAMDLGD